MVLLVVVDGMGLDHLTHISLEHEKTFGYSALDACDAVRLVDTRPVQKTSFVVADSASGATAMATGVKVHPGVIGTARRRGLARVARARGYKVAIVTTSFVADATPAGFVCRAASRDSEQKIAKQMFEFQPDILVAAKSRGRPGSMDVTEMAQEAYGPSNVDNINSEDVAEAIALTANTGVRVCALFEPESAKRRAVKLSAVVRALAKHLDQDRWFLLVEHAHVDKACHAQDLAQFKRECSDVVKTLHIVKTEFGTPAAVTADHATGAVMVRGRGKRELVGGEHVGVYVPLLLYRASFEDRTLKQTEVHDLVSNWLNKK